MTSQQRLVRQGASARTQKSRAPPAAEVAGAKAFRTSGGPLAGGGGVGCGRKGAGAGRGAGGGRKGGGVGAGGGRARGSPPWTSRRSPPAARRFEPAPPESPRAGRTNPWDRRRGRASSCGRRRLP